MIDTKTDTYKRFCLFYPIAAFVVTLIIGTFMQLYFQQKQNDQKQAVTEQMNLRIGTTLQQRIEESITATGILETLVEHSNYDTAKFDKWAENILQKSTHIDVLALAPEGVIRDSYSRSSEKNLLGFNLLQNHDIKQGTQIALKTRQLTFIGPITLGQNGKRAFIACKTIHKNDRKKRSFWGCALAVIYADTLTQGVFDAQEFAGARYALYGYDPTIRHALLILSSKLPPDSETKRHTVIVPNGKLFFQLQLKNPNESWNIAITLFNIAAAFLVALYVWRNEKHYESLMMIMLDYAKNVDLKHSRLNAIMNAATDGIHILDREGRLIEWSPSFARMLGYEEKEMNMLRMNDWDAMTSDEDMIPKIRSLMENPRTFESRHRRKDGTFYDVQIHSTVVDIDHKTYLYASARNITESKILQKALDEERKFSTTILDSAAAIIATIQPNGIMNSLNRYGEELTGYDAKTVSCEPYFWFDRFIPKGVRPDIQMILDSMVSDGVIIAKKENAWIDRNGEERMFEWSNSIVVDEFGKPLYLTTVGIDITEKMEAQRALKELNSELEERIHKATAELLDLYNLLQHTQQIAKIGSFHDKHSDAVVWCSQQIYEIYGFNRNFPITHEMLLGSIIDEDRLGFADMNVRMRYKRGPHSVDYRIVTGSQETKYLRIVWENYFDSQGEPVESVGTIQDITDKALMELQERQIFEEKERALELLEHTQKIAKIYSFRQELSEEELTVSSNLFNLYEIEPSEKVSVEDAGKFWIEETLERWKSSKFDPYVKTFDGTLLTARGNRRHFHMELNKTFDDAGNLTLIEGTVQDITARVEAESKAKEQEILLLHQNRLALQGEMLQMIAHQWRQPLNAIDLTHQVLFRGIERNTISEEKLNEYKHNLRNQVHHLSQTIDDFRNFYSINKAFEVFDLTGIQSSIDSIMDNTLRTKKISILYRIPEGIMLNSHFSELSQVFISIVNNAVDAFEGIGQENKLIRFDAYDEGDTVRIAITDNAGGISHDVIGKIFDPYFSTKMEKNGTGLGLYMSKMIVERSLGGTLRALNRDEGALFEIILPKERIDAA